MLDFLKRRLIVAEVDGIKFYRESALLRYLREKEERESLRRSRAGKREYTFEIPWYQRCDVFAAKVRLEDNGCFDYTAEDDYDRTTIRYWSRGIILKWKA